MKRNNYKSLNFYNSNQPKVQEEKYKKIEENFGAFSISGALKNPQIVNTGYIQYPGVS